MKFAKTDHITNSGDFYKLLPVGRVPVNPGSSLKDLRVNLDYRSNAFTKALLGDVGIVSMSAYYVPLRLIWPDYVDFMVDPSSGAAPTTATPWATMFDRGGSVSPLYRRAYKLVFNEFFADKEMVDGGPAQYYADILDDTDKTLYPVKQLSPVFTSVERKSDTEPYVHEVDVVGGVAKIDMDALKQAERINDNLNDRQELPNSYAGVLKALGVNLGSDLSGRPEPLGRSHTSLAITMATSSEDATLGNRVSTVSGKCGLRVAKTKYFAEQGMIIVVAAFRPRLFNKDLRSPIDGFLGNEGIYTGYEKSTGRYIGNAFLSVGTPVGDDMVLPPYAELALGQTMVGNTVSGVLTHSPDSVSGNVFPSHVETGTTRSEFTDADFGVVGTCSSEVIWKPK